MATIRRRAAGKAATEDAPGTSREAAAPAQKKRAAKPVAGTAGKTLLAQAPRGDAASAVVAAGEWSALAGNGRIDPLQVARDLGVTKSDLAATLGLPADALMREERIRADKTQSRLAEFTEILHRIEPWAGGLRPAFAWYRSQGIAALGGETAEALVKTDRAGHVRTYLNAIAAGAFA